MLCSIFHLEFFFLIFFFLKTEENHKFCSSLEKSHASGGKTTRGLVQKNRLFSRRRIFKKEEEEEEEFSRKKKKKNFLKIADSFALSLWSFSRLTRAISPERNKICRCNDSSSDELNGIYDSLFFVCDATLPYFNARGLF